MTEDLPAIRAESLGRQHDRSTCRQRAVKRLPNARYVPSMHVLEDCGAIEPQV